MAFRREDRIASGNGKGGMPLSIYYIGGSSFVLVKDGEEDHPLAKMTLKQVKKMISEKKVTLLRPKHLEEIENEVDPETGDTESHNADGSMKSTVDQMLSKYEKEGYIVDDGNGGVRTIDEDTEPQPRRRRRHRPQAENASSDGQSNGPQNRNGGVPLNADDPQEEPSQQTQERRHRRNRVDNTQKPEIIDDVDPFADIDTHTDDDNDEQPRSHRHKLSEYDSGDIQDDAPRRRPQKQKKERSANPDDDKGHIGGPLFVFLVVTVIICLVLFFGSLIIAKNIFHGKMDEQIAGKENTEQKQNTNTNANKSKNANKNKNAGSSTQTASGLDPIKRTDFDPEDAVKKYTMASSAEKQIADGFMKQVRSLIAKGDIDSFTQMVALDNVSSEIAIAYADLAQVRQNLTDDEKAELLQYYKNTLVQQERKHVTDKDLYASMFGGRVREVRQQAGKLYVVMESIGGDHQRACFVLTEDASSGSWALTDIVDTNGYVKMIGEGDTSQYVQDLKTTKTNNKSTTSN